MCESEGIFATIEFEYGFGALKGARCQGARYRSEIAGCKSRQNGRSEHARRGQRGDASKLVETSAPDHDPC